MHRDTMADLGVGAQTISTGVRSRTVPPSATVASDAETVSLDGTWRCRFSRYAGQLTDDVANPGLDDGGWDEITVPGHWVLEEGQPWGAPIYTNVVYPIPLDPPHVPDDNPTMDHRRTFEVPQEWTASGRVVLRTDGVESFARIWVNGTLAGDRLGSRLVHELDVTDLIHPGTNHLAMRVQQWSVGTYLEDQDQWWLPGIFREVTLRHRPVGCVDDVWVRTAYTPSSREGRLTVEVRADDTAWPVRVTVPELGVDVTAQSPGEPLEVAIPDVAPWSDEDPHLYEVHVEATGEHVTTRTGFRTIAVRDGVLLANNRPLHLRGVNRHEIDLHVGRVFDEDRVREDLALMKRHNVNAIRTAHYPPHPGVLDLADELGLWVMLECDLETHGFELDDWHRNPSDDPWWREHCLDRIERTVERDKNHPSIFSWSLGNESGRGENLAEMAAWVRDRDPDRLVHYEGDHQADYTQIYSRMYPALEEMTAFLEPEGPIAVAHHPASDVTEEQAARARHLPYLLVEYLHAMGTGPGGAADYARVIESDPRICGGFIWEWRDHALAARTSDGTAYLAYGGDFGEVLHDGNFCADGMVSAHGAPSSGLLDWAQTIAPVRATWDGDDVVVTSRRQHTTTEDLEIAWRVEVDGVEVKSGVLDLAPVAPASAVRVPRPFAGTLLATSPDGEAWLTLEVRTATTLAYAVPGLVLHRAQACLRAAEVAPPTPRGTSASPRMPRDTDVPVAPGTIRLGPALLERATGRLLALGDPVAGGIATTDHGLTTWRPPTDNDGGHGALDYFSVDPESTLGAGAGARGPSSAERWLAVGLDRMVPRVVRVDSGVDHLEVTTRWAAAGQAEGIVAEQRWTAVDERTVEMSLRVTPDGEWIGTWPRVGLHLALPLADWSAQWFGLGPGESYPDLAEGVHVGRHQRDLADLVDDQVVPQEAGHRSDVRWLQLSRGGASGLVVQRLSGTLGFGLRPWSPAELTAATHPHELPLPSAAHLTLDLAQNGLGSRSCGPDVRPEWALRPVPLSTSVTLSWID